MRYNIITAALLVVATIANAQMKTTKVSVFKNGTFFQKKEGTIKFTDKKGFLPVPDNALFGTYWLAAGANTSIKQIDIGVDTVKKDKRFFTLYDLVKANEGKTATLRFRQVLDPEKPSYRLVNGTIVNVSQYGIIRMKTAEGKNLFIPQTDLYDVEIDGNPNETLKADSLLRRATIFLDKQANDVPFTVVSLQTGMVWTPSYYIKLLNDKEARLMMKGTVENNSVEDIVNADLDLVVGSPNIFYGNQLDPVSSTYIAGLVSNGYYDNNYLSNATYNYAPAQKAVYGDASVAEAYEPPPAIIDGATEEYNTEGEKVSDLYYYRAGNVSIRKKTKSIIPISLANIPFKDIYECEIGDLTNYYSTRTIYTDELQKSDTYHSLKFTNKTTAPITTASVFVVNENEEPIAQDQIKYTPVGAETFIRLSKAVDVSVKSKDEESKKAEDVKKINKVVYDKVTLKGTIEVNNFLNKPITLNVKKWVYGEVTDNGGGKTFKRGVYNNLNPYTNLSWELDLPAGEKKILTFYYDVYIVSYN